MEMQENPTKTIQQLSDKILTLEEQNLVLEQRNAELNAQAFIILGNMLFFIRPGKGLASKK